MRLHHSLSKRTGYTVLINSRQEGQETPKTKNIYLYKINLKKQKNVLFCIILGYHMFNDFERESETDFRFVLTVHSVVGQSNKRCLAGEIDNSAPRFPGYHGSSCDLENESA